MFKYKWKDVGKKGRHRVSSKWRWKNRRIVRAAYEVKVQGQKNTNGIYLVKYLVNQLELPNK